MYIEYKKFIYIVKLLLFEEVYLKIDIVEKIIMYDIYVYVSNFIKDKFIKF